MVTSAPTMQVMHFTEPVVNENFCGKKYGNTLDSGCHISEVNSKCSDLLDKKERYVLSIDELRPPHMESEVATLKKGITFLDGGITAASFEDYDPPTNHNRGRKSSSLYFGSPSKLYDEMQLNEAVQAVDLMTWQGINVSADLLFHLLQRCIAENDLAAGRELNHLVVRTGLESDPFLGSHLIRMFTLFECLLEANQVFSRLLKPTVFSWSAIISAHARLGQNEEAIRLYHQMQSSSVQPDGHTFVAVIKACSSIASLEQGRQVHSHVLESRLDSDVFVGSTLIGMYLKCRRFDDAQKVFENLPVRNVVMWNTLITGYANAGDGQEALVTFEQMQQEGMQPNRVTFVAMLRACSCIAALRQGCCIHSIIMESGLELDEYIGNTLIDMYVQCDSLDDARAVFDKLLKRDVVTWNTLLGGYARHGNAKQALQLFEQMQEERVQLDRVTFISILNACSAIMNFQQGGQIHALIVKNGLDSDLFVGNTLLDMYAKCGSLKDAHRSFMRLPTRNVVTWSALITGHVQNGHDQLGFQLLRKMQEEYMEPSPVIFACILKSCSCRALLDKGMEIHACIIERGFESDLFLGNSLIDMYVNCRSLRDAWEVFGRLPKRDVVTWSLLIAGHAQNGHAEEAFRLFKQMQQDGMEANLVTVLWILKACSSCAALEQGRGTHAHIIKRGFQSDVQVGAALIDMYAKCGSLKDAFVVFDELPWQDVVTWSALISGYAQHGYGLEALRFFKHMKQEGIEPNIITFISIFKACSSIAALGQGRQIHSQIVENGFEIGASVGNALIDMYAKCGSMEDACTVFHTLSTRDVVTWSALIAGYARHSNYPCAYEYFNEMQRAGLKPDDVTFLFLLSACAHAGLMEKGWLHFKSMREDHGIAPTVEHYNSMVDLLGHAGLLNEAEDLLESIPFCTNVVGWTSLLSSCRTLANVILGRRCFNHVVKIEPGNAAAYVLMSNLYTYAGLQRDADKLLKVRGHACLWNKAGKAFIEIDNEVHGFTVGDKSHPQSHKIYAKLDMLSMQMKEGHEPLLDLGMGLSPDKSKREALCGHCEKLAIAFGLISTPQGTTIRVAKNLRMCADCHIATEKISKIEIREIIVVDTYCIHEFQNGECSCKYKY